MNGNELQITVTQVNDATMLSLSGRVSVDSSPMLRHQLLSVLKSKSIKAMLIVDLSEAPYIDVSGIATLIEALKFARNHNVALRLAGVRGRLKNLFEVTGVLVLFERSFHTTASSTPKAL
jgi:anti-anti-sigma factor